MGPELWKWTQINQEQLGGSFGVHFSELSLDIFFTDFPHLHNLKCLKRETFVFDVVDGW